MQSYVLFVIYLLMCYSLFRNPFEGEIVFYRNHSIHFCCTWFDLFLSDVGFHWVEFTNPLEGYFCSLRSFYKPTFAIIYLTAIRFSIIDVLSYQNGFNLFVFDAIPVSSVHWREEVGAFYNNKLEFSNISIFYLILLFPYGSIFCRLDLIRLLFLIIDLILNGIMFFHFKKCRNSSLPRRVYPLTTLYLLMISNLLEYL